MYLKLAALSGYSISGTAAAASGGAGGVTVPAAGVSCLLQTRDVTVAVQRFIVGRNGLWSALAGTVNRVYCHTNAIVLLRSRVSFSLKLHCTPLVYSGLASRRVDCLRFMLPFPVAADRTASVRAIQLLFRGVHWMLPVRDRATASPGATAGGRCLALTSLFPRITKAIADFVSAAGHVSRLDVEVCRPLTGSACAIARVGMCRRGIFVRPHVSPLTRIVAECMSDCSG